MEQRDRPVELTKEAVAAGAEALESYTSYYELSEEGAVTIFCAMMRRLGLSVRVDGLSELLQSASQPESQQQ